MHAVIASKLVHPVHFLSILDQTLRLVLDSLRLPYNYVELALLLLPHLLCMLDILVHIVHLLGHLPDFLPLVANLLIYFLQLVSFLNVRVLEVVVHLLQL